MHQLDQNKRWLVSKLKSSGSIRSNLYNGSYADDRNTKIPYCKSWDDLPKRESHKKTPKIIQGKINFGPLFRFIEIQIGKDWDNIYSEINSRIPSKLKYCINIVDDIVAIRTELRDGYLYNSRNNKCIKNYHSKDLTLHFDESKYYVDFRTNILHKKL